MARTSFNGGGKRLKKFQLFIDDPQSPSQMIDVFDPGDKAKDDNVFFTQTSF